MVIVIVTVEISSVQGWQMYCTCHCAEMEPLGRCARVAMWLYLRRGW